MATGTFDILHPGHLFYLNEARKLGGADAHLVVVIATDKTVKEHKKVPVIGEKQRCEMVNASSTQPNAFGCVDEAFIGDEDDPFKIVKEQKPDIIAIGPDQKFNPENLEAQLKSIGIDVKAVKIDSYKEFELDSSCKIIKKIKNTHFNEKYFDECGL